MSISLYLSIRVCRCYRFVSSFVFVSFPLFRIIFLSCCVRVYMGVLVYLGGARLSRRSPSILEEPVYPGGARIASRRSPSILEEPVWPGGARLSVEKNFAPS